MNQPELLAKSSENGGLTLRQHTGHVVTAIEKFAHALGFDVAIARKGAILHDLGKGHPHFQHKIGGDRPKTDFEQRELNKVCHRHELSSLGFLPLFPRDEWDTLIDLVVAHHKSTQGDPAGRGILDLAENDREWLDFHLQKWENWSPQALWVAEQFGLPTRPISLAEARAALEYALAYCEKRPTGVSRWKGLLRAADHFASAFNDELTGILPRTFQRPDLAYYHSEARRHDLYPLSHLPTDDPSPHTLVIAPTGAGKTDYLLRRCRGRVFYTLPFQASINAMFERIRKDVPEADVRLLHATSRLKVKGNQVEQTLQPLVGAAVKVLTPHQMASIIFGTAGFETVMLDVRGTDVILDEIHTYSDWSGAMVREMVRALLRLECRIHVGTATIPSVLYRQILDLLGGPEQVLEVSLPDELLDTFDRHVVHREPNQPERIAEILRDAFAAGERVLLVHNTVKDAQASYQMWRGLFPDMKMMLIHSRFRRKDRVRLENELKADFNDRKKAAYSPCLVISTQVVEVSLDISFDRMITDCAPLDALVQRFGRVNRVRNDDTIGRHKPVHVLAPEGSALPYKKEILDASFAQLSDGALLSERSIQARIDAVYPTVESKEIDFHLIFKEGRYHLRELTHRPKSIIVDALEIESATCILESDRAAYEAGHWEERIGLDIPVAWKTLKYSGKTYVQLEGIGSWPFVIPQCEAEHQELGLILHASEKFI